MKQLLKTSFVLLALGCLLISVSASGQPARKPQKNEPKYVEVVSKGNLTIYYPNFSKIDLVVESMPSKNEEDVIFCCEAAFTGEKLTEFKHSNIAGHHVCSGTYYEGFHCGPNNGVFTWSRSGGWHFYNNGHKNSVTPLKAVAAKGGMGFCQSMLFCNGTQFKGCFKPEKENQYRALCEVSGRLCIVDCAKSIPFGDFLSGLKALGVKNAVYLDMGWGWNYSWYRKDDGSVKETYVRKNHVMREIILTCEKKCFTLRKNNQMKEILAQAYDLVEIVRNVNSCFLQKDPNNLKLSDYREAELACKRIDELHLHEPILFYCHLDDELQDDNRFDRLRTKIIDSIKKYMEWFLSNSAILCRRVNTLSPVFAEIEKEADEKFSKELRDTSERMIYVSRGDQEVIRPFTRRYGFISGPNGELTQEQIQELLPSARRMIEYFNLPFKVPEQFLDLYNWFQDGYKPLYFKTQDECAEVKRRRDDYVLLLWHRVDTNVFEALYDRIIPFNVELQEDPNKKIKARGEHGTPKNVQCFRDCFITADDFETFLSVAEDYARIHNISGPDAASAYRYLKVGHLKTGVAMSRFLKYFNDDYPTLYTRKANSNVMASEYSAFVNSLKKKYE